MTDIDTIEETMDKLRAINQAFRKRVAMDAEIAKLDADGRHRSQWIYSYYDGRQDKEIPHGAGYEINPTDRTE